MLALFRLSLIAVLLAGPAWVQGSKPPAYSPDEADTVAEKQALKSLGNILNTEQIRHNR